MFTDWTGIIHAIVGELGGERKITFLSSDELHSQIHLAEDKESNSRPFHPPASGSPMITCIIFDVLTEH